MSISEKSKDLFLLLGRNHAAIAANFSAFWSPHDAVPIARFVGATVQSVQSQ